MREQFDLCILGAGPAGYAAAMRAHDLGKTVALIERGRVGGAGIHAGALSSKTFWHLSNDFVRAQRTDRGFSCRDVVAHYRDVVRCVHEALSERELVLSHQLEMLAARGIRLFRGAARFTTPHEVVVRPSAASEHAIGATFFLVATGSTPRVPEGICVDGERILTSDHIEQLAAFPKSLAIIGAGVVGCEYATIFANFAQTQISILDRQPRILPFEDDDVAELIAKNFEQAGIHIHRASKLCSLVNKGPLVEYTIEDSAGKMHVHEAERVLVSTGRTPNTANIGLEEIGVVREKNGSLAVVDTQTSVPHIFAAGDVTMDVALVNVAELEGRYAVERMFGAAPGKIHYDALAAIMFLRPEVASVGLNELAAKQKKIAYRVGVVHNRLIVRNVAMRATDGFVKLVAEREAPHRILGLRVVGPQASSTIQGVAFLIERAATLSDLEHCMHPHPAIPEGVQECARLMLGRSIHKPEVFGPHLMRVAEG